jgi:hypothetical protein
VKSVAIGGLGVVGVAIAIVAVLAMIGAVGSGSQPPSRQVCQSQANLSLEALKGASQPLSYQDMARSPADHMCWPVVERGKVVQVMGAGDAVANLRVEITPGQFNLWKDTVLVVYRRPSLSEPRILDGDIVRMWGTYAGITSYKAVLGQTIELPLIYARAIEQSK